MTPAFAPAAPARARPAPAPRRPAASSVLQAPAVPALQRAARSHGLAPITPLPAGRRVLQRFAWPDTKSPELVAEDFEQLRAWAHDEPCWPTGRTMAQWVAKAATNEEVQEQWKKFEVARTAAADARLTKRFLTLTATRLKAHVEKTYESALSAKEIEEKTAHVDNLVKAIPPSVFDGRAYSREKYKEELLGKVLASPRYMQSIKAKDPYVEHKIDDDASPGGPNATLIKQRIDIVRAGAQLTADLKPGTDTPWEKWRENDCLFAAILRVLLGKNSPTTDEKDQEKAALLADTLKVAHGVVDDPVILALMERLGWPYTRRASWARFVADANTRKPYVLSLDTLKSGKASHVVVAYHQAGEWRIYDRQAVRLGRAPLTAAPHPDNPLDSWEVAATDAARELATTLKD